MPPKQKINQEDILAAAFQLVRESGMEPLNARSIAKALHCSTQPVFSYYATMADLKADVFIRANQYHADYFNKVETGEDVFLNVGLAYVEFALEEPNLFRLLFMSGGFDSSRLGEIVAEDCNEHVVNGMPSYVDRGTDEANAVFTDMWMYAHGVAAMLVMNQLNITREEIREMITRVFRSLVRGLTPKEE